MKARYSLAPLRLRDRQSDRLALPVLFASVAGLVAVSDVAGLDIAPASLLTLPVLAGGLLLVRRRNMIVTILAALAGSLTLVGLLGLGEVRAGNVLLVGAVGAVSYLLVASRERLGVTGLRGESMLVELRERLKVQGELPGLPYGWCWEMEQRSAGGVGFGGDFLVSALIEGGNGLELALVDVSGKGIDAGTRALMLSGALGGLLGSVPPEEFLRAANGYLRRQGWEEGFATAIHIAIDLVTGEYLLDSAGHPPAAQFKGGSGVWTLSSAEGSALGIFDDGKWDGVHGVLEPGDALLLFTDGLVEVPGRDLELGVDKLLGEANRLVISTFEGGASKLIDAVAPAAIDDRALAMIWRT